MLVVLAGIEVASVDQAFELKDHPVLVVTIRDRFVLSQHQHEQKSFFLKHDLIPKNVDVDLQNEIK